MDNVLVSIIIPIYNREHLIDGTLDLSCSIRENKIV